MTINQAPPPGRWLAILLAVASWLVPANEVQAFVDSTTPVTSGVVDGPESYGYTISSSSTNPFVNTGAPSPGVITIYLWMTCSPLGGSAAFEAGLTTSYPVFGFTPMGPSLNLGSAPAEPRLIVGACPTGQTVLGSWTVFDAGAGGNACLTINPSTGINQTATCSASPVALDNSCLGFASDGSSPCTSPGGLCGANGDRAQVRIGGYTTAAYGIGQYIGCGLMTPPLLTGGVVTVDDVNLREGGTNTAIPGVVFAADSTTGASFGSPSPSFTGTWNGFLAQTTAAISAGTAVDLVFEVTMETGTTLQQLGATIQASLVGTDEADSTGAITGGRQNIVTPVTQTSAPLTVEVSALGLHDPVPNPFRQSTTIGFDLPAASFVDLNVYDVAGRHVRTLESGERGRGAHQVEWNGQDGTGAEVAAGIYFYRLKIGEQSEVRKVVLLR